MKTGLLIIVFIVIIFADVQCEKISHESKNKEGFQLSDTEKRCIEEILLQIKTSRDIFDLNKVLDLAMNGNPVALHIAGQFSLLGNGTAINRNVAYDHFKMAASLGYAPALYEITQMYINEDEDPLLGLVYLNLTVTFGHTEYRGLYLEQTDLLSKRFGKKIVHEIERLALEKTNRILELRKNLDERILKPALILISRGIVSEDLIFTEDYWRQFFKSQESWEQFFGKIGK